MGKKITRRPDGDVRQGVEDSVKGGVRETGSGDGVLLHADPFGSSREIVSSDALVQDDVPGADAGEDGVGRSVLLSKSRRGVGDTDNDTDRPGLRSLEDSESSARGTDGELLEQSVGSGSRVEIKDVPLPEWTETPWKPVVHARVMGDQGVRIVCGAVYERTFKAREVFQEDRVAWETFLLKTNLFEEIRERNRK